MLKSFTNWDKFIMGGLLVICLLSSIYVYVLENTSKNNEEVVIKVQGKIIKEIP